MLAFNEGDYIYRIDGGEKRIYKIEKIDTLTNWVSLFEVRGRWNTHCPIDNLDKRYKFLDKNVAKILYGYNK